MRILMTGFDPFGGETVNPAYEAVKLLPDTIKGADGNYRLMMNKRSKLIKLFLSTLYLSAFTFGGGYVIVTLLKTKFVNELHWIDEEEMLDLVAIAQSSPGAIAVNGAIVVGYKLAGGAGVFVSVKGAVIPPILVISVVSACYDAFASNWFVSAMLRGMNAGVGAVIASVVYDMGKSVMKEKQIASIIVMFGSFAASYIFGINVMIVITAAACIGVFRFFMHNKRRERK